MAEPKGHVLLDNVVAIYLGTNDVTSLYLGEDEVWTQPGPLGMDAFFSADSGDA